jgi:hypothetical protein
MARVVESKLRDWCLRENLRKDHRKREREKKRERE